MPHDATSALKLLGGAATLREILGHTTRRALRSAEGRGEIERLAVGVYALPEAGPATKRAAAMRGVLSHESAAAHWLMEMIHEPTSVHVTVPRNARPRPRKGVTLHHANLDAERVTSPLRTVLDCARTMPFREALAIADSACRRDLVTSGQLVAAALQLRGAGRQRVLRVVSHADPRSANPFESAMRAIVIEAGLSGFEPQLEIVLESGPIYVDLGDRQRKVCWRRTATRITAALRHWHVTAADMTNWSTSAGWCSDSATTT